MSASSWASQALDTGRWPWHSEDMGEHRPLPDDPAEREIERRRRHQDHKATRKGWLTRRAKAHIERVRAERANLDLIQ